MGDLKVWAASERTVDMFSGRTQAEVVQEAKRIAADEDISAEAKAEAVPMEDEADRWRAQTFKTQEWMTKNFPIQKGDQGSQFRISYGKVASQGWYYLEELHSHSGQHVTSYKGFMVREEDLFQLADVIVAAARAKKQKESL